MGKIKNKTMTKILYLHGLEGNLPEEKRKVLQQIGEVWGNDIDYRKPKILKELSQIAIEFKPNYIIGSSMGGYIGFMISKIINVPCLLFNPAFPYRTIEPDISGVEIPNLKTAKTSIILGKKDRIIKYEDNLKYITENLNSDNIELIEIEELEHRIPFEIFENEVNKYFEK
jgi:esterase/lipase